MTLLLIFFISTFSLASEKMPQCVRPSDFSNGKFVASYETCLKRRETFCNSHKESKPCQSLPVHSGKPYYKTTVDDIEPSKRCQIQKDATYKCLQDPIRIIPAAEADVKSNATAPAATPSGSPAPESGTNGGEQEPKVMPPPPRPK